MQGVINEIKLILKGVPLSTNQIYRATAKGGRVIYYMTRKGKELKTNYQWQLKTQFRRSPLVVPLTINIRLYFNRKGSHDLDNYLKILFDACEGIVFTNDSQIRKMIVEKHYDPSNPRIELDIY